MSENKKDDTVLKGSGNVRPYHQIKLGKNKKAPDDILAAWAVVKNHRASPNAVLTREELDHNEVTKNWPIRFKDRMMKWFPYCDATGEFAIRIAEESADVIGLVQRDHLRARRTVADQGHGKMSLPDQLRALQAMTVKQAYLIATVTAVTKVEDVFTNRALKDLHQTRMTLFKDFAFISKSLADMADRIEVHVSDEGQSAEYTDEATEVIRSATKTLADKGFKE